VGATPFFKAAQIPGLEALQQQWPTVLQELNKVLQQADGIPNFQDISKDQKRLSQDDRWKTYFLYGYGYKMEGNCLECPETTRIVESIPGMSTAFFSILSPGKHIPAHRGPYNGVLRVHLGLVIPEPKEQCRIEVGGETRHWELGECMVFDDSYRHEVWNDTDGVRVVLFLDVQRPLDWPGRVLNKIILKLIQLSPYIQDARKNHLAWEKKGGTAG
jgi:beta-hydroxylase